MGVACRNVERKGPRLVILSGVILAMSLASAAGKDCQGDRWQELRAEAGPSGQYVVMEDAEVFAALDLSRPGLEEVRRAVEQRQFGEAYGAWGRYWAKRDKPFWVFDPDAYRRALKEDMPWLVPIMVQNADKTVRRELRPYSLSLKPQGRTFDWGDDNNDNTFIAWHYMFWVSALPRAYALTGDERYATMFADVATEWYDALPDVLRRLGALRFDDVVWGQMAGASLGAPIRAQNLLEAYWMMRRSKALTPEVHARMLRIVLGHARIVYDNDMRKYTYFNGQNSGLAYLMSAAIMLPEFKEAAQWRAVSLPLVRRHLSQSFLADGGHTEVSINYHIASVRDYRHILRLMQRNNDRELLDDPSLMENLHKAVIWLLAVSLPDGNVPAISAGSYNSDWLVYAGLTQTFFSDPTLRWVLQHFVKPGWVPLPTPVVEDLLGPVVAMDETFAAALRDPLPAQPPSFTSVILPDSGFAVLRDGWERDANTMVLDFSRPTGPHGYPNKLSFILYAKGTPVALHPGTPTSYSSKEYHEWIDQTVSHNTVLVNGHSPQRNYYADLEHWHDLRQIVFLGAKTDVYRHSDGVVHRRFVTFLPQEYYVVFDLLKGGSAATLRWLFHCPKPLTVETDNQKRVHTPAGEPGVLLVPAKPEEIVEVTQAVGLSVVPVDRPYQKNYRADVPYIGYSKTIPAGGGGQTYSVVIAPFEKEIPSVEVRSLATNATKCEAAHAAGLVASWPDHRDWHMVNGTGGEATEWEDVTSDALRTFLRFPRAATPKTAGNAGSGEQLPSMLALAGGSLLRVGGKTLVEGKLVRALTLQRKGLGWSGWIETDGQATLRVLAPSASKASVDGRPVPIVRDGEYVVVAVGTSGAIHIE